MTTEAATITSRGTVTIDVEPCKGCELCIPACPPRVLTMSTPTNHMGYRYPELHPGCTGCAACLLRLPRLLFEVFRFDTPVAPTSSRRTATHDRDRARAARELMEGSEALARAVDRRRLPVLRRLPDDAVHRAARALRPPAARGRRRVHQRRVRARGRRHGVGRALDGRPRRDRLDRPGPLAHAGVVLRDHAGRAAARHLQHGARPAGLLPGDTRRRPRRLPPHRARARRTSARASSSRSSRSTSPTSGATPCSSTATTCSRTRRRRSTIEPIDVPRRCRRRTGRSTARAPARVSRRASRRSASRKLGQRDFGQEGKAQYIATKMPLMEREVRVETGYLDDAETVIVAFGTPGQVREVRDRQLRDEGTRSATCGRSRCGRSRTTRCAPRRERRARVGSFELSSGQMVDDVRIGVAGPAPVDVHRRHVDRPLRLRRRPAARRRRRPRAHPRVARGPRARRRCPATTSSRYDAAAAPGGGSTDDRTPIPLGPVIDTSTPPASDARRRRAQKPDLLLTEEHHMCPGCGEPLAVRAFLEAIEELGSAERAIAVAGIGCYTSFSGTMDVDLVQALHGRAPSVATGVKRMLPDALVFTLQGDGDMVNEGLQEVLHTAARGERVTCILLNNGVFGETGGHMTATSVHRPAHEELARRPRRRVPRLPDPHRRPASRSSRARRTSRAGRCTTPARWPGRRRCSGGRSRRRRAGEGFSFVEVLTMCPTGWFIPTADGPELHAARRSARCTSWAS